jgi:hypothetical protein
MEAKRTEVSPELQKNRSETLVTIPKLNKIEAQRTELMPKL